MLNSSRVVTWMSETMVYMKVKKQTDPLVMLGTRVPYKLRYALRYTAAVTETPIQEIVCQALLEFLAVEPESQVTSELDRIPG